MFGTEMKVANRWRGKTEYQYGQTFKLFTIACTNKIVGEVTKADAASFKTALINLPPTYGKSAANKVTDVALPVRKEGQPGLSAATINKHLTAMHSFFDWAANNGHVRENVFANMQIRETKNAIEERPAWSPEDIRTILDSPLYTGCKSTSKRHVPGKLVIKDARYWVPLIGMYSGMRLEEICQLPPSDVRQVGGIWCFDIRPGENKQLKSNSATRLVPVHSELIKLGFLELVAERLKEGSARIFKELKSAAFDKFSDQISKWFGRFRKQLDVDQRCGFHSFRHAFATELRQARVPEDDIESLLGHAKEGETRARYIKENSIPALHDTIERLHYQRNLPQQLSAHASQT